MSSRLRTVQRTGARLRVRHVIVLVFSIGVAASSASAIAASKATSLYISPAMSKRIAVGSTFAVEIRARTSGDVVNAVAADLTYSANLSYVGINVNSNVWGVTALARGDGAGLSVQLGSFAAVSGDQLIATVTFTALSQGKASISFAPSSQLDSAETNANVLASTKGVTLKVVAAGSNTVSSTGVYRGPSQGWTTLATGSIETAIKWASARVGAGLNYNGLCLQFVRDAYASGGVSVASASSAYAWWSSPPSGAVRHGSDIAAPRGALVFWGPSPPPSSALPNPDGHVGISLGGGQVISSASYPKTTTNKDAVHIFTIKARNDAGYQYLGWASPPGVNLGGARGSDINSDASVNISDLSILLTNYNVRPAIPMSPLVFASDINQDGVVNIFDLSILLANYAW